MDNKNKTAKNGSAFKLFFVFPIMLVVLVLSLAILGILTAHAADAQTPRQAVDAYFEALSVGDFQQINQESGFTPSPLCSWQDYDQYLRQTYGDDLTGLAISEPKSGEDGSQLFTITRDGTAIGQISAEQRENTRVWRVFTLIEEDYRPYTITAPAHLQITANGLSLSQDNVIKTETAEGYESLPSDIEPPSLLTYETPALLAQPKVVATDSTGQSPAVAHDEENKTAIVSLPLQDDGYISALEEAFEQYADYLTGDSNFEDLEPLLLSGSLLYESLTEPTEGYLGYTIEISGSRDMMEWSNETFSGTVDFLAQDTEDEDAPPLSAAVMIYLVRYEEEWRIASILEVA